MAAVLVHVVKVYEGEEFENTYGVWMDSPIAGIPNEDMMTSIGAGGDFNNVSTTPTNGAYQGGSTILHAIIGFERLVLPPWVTFKNIYVTDGKKPNALAPGNAFINKAIEGQGLRDDIVTQDSYAPGNVAMLISRVPSGFSAHQGRIEMRALLLDTHVRFGGKGAVAWKDDAAAAAVKSMIQTAVFNAELNLYFGDGQLGGDYATGFGIPHYFPGPSVPAFAKGDLIGITPISQLVPQRPMSRQVVKGKRKKKVVSAPDP